MTDVHLVAHTHWDREWYLTREQYRLRLVALIDGVLERMRREPDFRCFHLDGQTIVLEDYLEVRPEQEARLRERIAQGRLLVGPWYVMPDMHLVGGESLVRNLALGHGIAEDFGGVMPVGYMPDPFGHVAQMPQILAGFGLDSAILWRGFGGERAEYRWEAPDGTSVLLLHLPREGYCNALWPALLPEAERAEAARRVVERERARSACDVVLLMAGVDHVEPAPGLLQMAGALDRLPELNARLSTLPAYVGAVQAALRGRDASLQLIRGELRAGENYAPLLPGVLSARGYLKQANARVERALERCAEPAAAFAWLLGARHPDGELGYAWRTLLQNHPHDSICGCSVDAVHEENLTRFARAGQTADGIEQRALETIGSALPPAPAGAIRAVALNTDIHPFEGVLEGELDLPYALEGAGRTFEPAALERPLGLFPAGSGIAALTGPGGEAVPFQVLASRERVVHFMSRFEPPLAVRARTLRVALRAQLPACGLLAFDARIGPVAEGPAVTRRDPSGPGARAGDGWLENELLRVELNDDGTLEVHDKRSGRRLRRALELEDGGDVGDEYNYAPPARDRVVTSREATDVSAAVEQRGPLLAQLGIRLSLALPAAALGDRQGRAAGSVALPIALRVRLAAGSPRVEVEVELLNRARDHRLRLLVPTGATRAAVSRAGAAFGVVERPGRRTAAPAFAVEAPVSSAPLHGFADAGDAAAGVSLFSDGLAEYELTDEPEPRLALTLLRCVGWLSRDDLGTRHGHAGPGLETPGAQCLGDQRFRLAFAPRSAPPAEAELYRDARAFLSPPRLFAPAGRHGGLATRHAFLEAICEPAGGAVLSTLKRALGRNSLILRLFNPGDAPARVALGLPGGLAAAYRTDLRERRIEALPLVDSRLQLTLAGRKIVTLELDGPFPGDGGGGRPA